jgi:hypothetical protein
VCGRPHDRHKSRARRFGVTREHLAIPLTVSTLSVTAIIVAWVLPSSGPWQAPCSHEVVAAEQEVTVSGVFNIADAVFGGAPLVVSSYGRCEGAVPTGAP